ncbi:MAG: ATP synthase F1 subunit delta [Saprospiraceae bacterium]
MSVARIASRYAKSLIDLAVEQNKLERIMEDVQSFNQLTAIRDFYLLIKSPIIKGDKKWAITQEILKGKFDDLTLAFIKILINKGREGLLPEIGKEFIQQYRKIKHISIVTIKTATKLSDAQLEAIKAKLVASSVTDDKVEILTEVDPELLGGFVVEFDDRLYDASVKHQLRKLKKDFESNLYVSQVISQ